MNYHDDILDQAEEIYLTQQQYIRWMCADTTRPDIFGVRDGKVVLKNMSAAAERWNQPPPPSELQLIVRRAFGPSKNVCGATISPPAPPLPKSVRKLERPEDAVWTFFNRNSYIIGVHDDGTVVVRLAIDWCPNPEYRITRDGTILERNRVVDGETFAIWAGRFAKILPGALKAWVQRVEGRKMPPGIQRLIKRSAEARKIWPPRIRGPLVLSYESRAVRASVADRDGAVGRKG